MVTEFETVADFGASEQRLAEQLRQLIRNYDMEKALKILGGMETK